MKIFKECQSIEDAKILFRSLAFKNHPDQGGTEEGFKLLMSEYESFLNGFIFNRFESAGEKRTKGASVIHFQEILNKIIQFNMDIEIIGFWIYAKSSFEYKDQLKELGFWFSGKHKAWVYSGGAKIRRASGMSLDEIRVAHGSEKMREEKQRKGLNA